MKDEKTTVDERVNTPLSKEEILERSRNENKNGDEMFKKNRDKATMYGVLFSVVFMIAIFLAEVLIKGKVVVSYASISIIWSITGGINLLNGIFNKKTSLIVAGALGLTAAVAFFISCIIGLLQ